MTSDNVTPDGSTTEPQTPPQRIRVPWRYAALPEWPDSAVWSDVFETGDVVFPGLRVSCANSVFMLMHDEFTTPLEMPLNPREGWAILKHWLYGTTTPMLRMLEAPTLYYRVQLLTAGVMPNVTGADVLFHNWRLMYFVALVYESIDRVQWYPVADSDELDDEHEYRVVPHGDDLLVMKFRALAGLIDAGELPHNVLVDICRKRIWTENPDKRTARRRKAAPSNDAETHSELAESPSVQRKRARKPRASETPAAPAADESPEHG